MGITNKLIIDWKRILIDTSIICNLFNSEKEGIEDQTIIFIRKLIDFLNNQRSSDSKERTFLISTVTISELLTKEQDAEKIKKILKVLNSDNVEFIPFDFETSLSFNRFLYPHLSNKSLNRKAEIYGFKTHEFMMAREWISRDLMILCSGLEHGADVVITADKNTMYPSAIDLNMFCVLAYPELFETFGSAVTSYKYDEVEKFINNKSVEKESIN
jgi:predicted nucleic acid-binding protein